MCEKLCQVTSIKMEKGKAVIELNKCVGGGLCVTSCPADGARLFLKSENGRVY